jgi:ribulose-phosphate 3-epimerase
VELEVDGGIKLGNIHRVARAGVTVFVSGSGVLETADYASTILRMSEEIGQAMALGGLHEEKGRLSSPR